jgi:hypothetical protein
METVRQHLPSIRLDMFIVKFFGGVRRKASQDRAMQRQISTNQREAPGQDKGRSQEEEIYICSSRLGLIKMDHHHSGHKSPNSCACIIC